MGAHKAVRIGLIGLLAVLSAGLAGCVVCGKEVKYTGVEDETLKEIRCGEMTRAELVERIGEPSEQCVTEDGAEVLKYRCTKKQESGFVVFPVLVIGDEKESEHVVVFEIRDGIVRRYWKES